MAHREGQIPQVSGNGHLDQDGSAIGEPDAGGSGHGSRLYGARWDTPLDKGLQPRREAAGKLAPVGVGAGGHQDGLDLFGLVRGGRFRPPQDVPCCHPAPMPQPP